MGQLASKLFLSTSELAIVHHRTYHTKCHGITAIKIQPNGGNLLAAANELGSLLLYDLLAETDLPQQSKILSFEFGGISDLLWVTPDILVAGTTRGCLVVFNMQNDAGKLFEICNIKAHGDGASMVAVQSIDFCATTNCLVSVGQGAGSIRLWNVASNGMLTSRDIPSPIAFCEPRFVGFMHHGSHVLVGFFEHALFQKWAIEPWALVEEHTLGQYQGAIDNKQLGNAVLLEGGRLLVYNLKNGFDIYDTAKFTQQCSGRYDVNFCCSQGVSTLRDGSYVVALSNKGRINIYRTRDQEISLAVTFKLRGRGASIQAVHVHASSNSSNAHDVVAAASCAYGKESTLTIWMDTAQRLKLSKKSPMRAGDYSALQIVLLSIFVYVICQLMTSLLIPNLAIFSRSLVGPILDFNNGAVDHAVFINEDGPEVTANFPIDSNLGPTTINRAITRDLAKAQLPDIAKRIIILNDMNEDLVLMHKTLGQ